MSESVPRIRKRAAKPPGLSGPTTTPRLRPLASGGTSAQPVYMTSSLGTDYETGDVLTLGDKERRSGLYILGRPGMGKSTMLVNLALQDIEHGHGLFFLDPHEDAIRDILKRLPRSRKQDVLLFNVTDQTHSFGINLVACDNPASLDARRDAYTKAYEVFHSLWQYEWGPWLQLIIANLIRALIENKDYTLAAAPRFLTDADFRQKLVANIQYNRRVADFWNDRFAIKRALEQDREVAAALTRIETLLTDTDVAHVIGQKKTTLNFSRIMRERKVVLVSFPANLPDDTKRFLGTILVRELLWAARARRGDRSQFCLFVDEFQNFVTPDFSSIIRETRKFGIAPTLAQQFSLGEEHKGVNEAIDAMANMVVFQPTKADAERKAKEFADRPEPAYLETVSEAYYEPLKEEELRRIEDEVESGVEPIPALAQNPVDHLLRGHSDPEVGRLTAGALKPLENALGIAQAETEDVDVWEKNLSQERVFLHTLNGREYVATRQQLLLGRQAINDLLSGLNRGAVAYGSREMREQLQGIVVVLRGFLGYADGAMSNQKRDSISWSEWVGGRIGHRETREVSASRVEWVDVELAPEIEEVLPVLIDVIVGDVPTATDSDTALAQGNDMQAAKQTFQRARVLHYLQISKGDRDSKLCESVTAGEYREELWEDCQKIREHEPPQHIEDNFLAPPPGLSLVTRQSWLAVQKAAIQELTQVAQAEYSRLVAFLMQLSKLCVALSVPEQGITIPSGQYRPRKETKLTYIYIPEKELLRPQRDILHSQRSVADMVAEKELDLLGLAPYTAAYKLLLSGGGSPVKGVVSTFELPSPHPYYIVHGLRRAIIARTHQEYSQPRDKIEEELRAEMREDQTSGPNVAGSTQPSAVPEQQGKSTRRRRSEVLEE